MTPWLVITLMAPLASFGERAGNVERSTADRPSRSALIGLAGAALGIRRDDQEGQTRLARSFRIATATLAPGSLLSDFHTYQSLPSASKPAPRTRAEALSRKRELNTSITRREYRADVWYEVAYATEADSTWTLAQLATAFQRPYFALYLGRRSCPLGAPVNPVIIEAEDIVQLFEARMRNAKLAGRPQAGRNATLAAETLEDFGSNARPLRRHRRQDQPGDRLRWQFTARPEFVMSTSILGR